MKVMKRIPHVPSPSDPLSAVANAPGMTRGSCHQHSPDPRAPEHYNPHIKKPRGTISTRVGTEYPAKAEQKNGELMALTPAAGELPNVGLALAGSEGQGAQLYGPERSRRGCSACCRGAISVSGGEGKTMPEWIG
jgi:hypothetical protein